MNNFLLRKINLNKNSLSITVITGILTTVINRTKFKDAVPIKNFFYNLIIGIGVIQFNKNKLAKSVGSGILIASAANLIYNLLKTNNCPFIFKPNKPINDSLLINLKTGRIIQKNNIQRGVIFVTNYDTDFGWNKSFKLKYCLTFKSDLKGNKPKKGQLVLWNYLKDHTSEFNKLLLYWINFFKKLNYQFEEHAIDFKYKLSYWIYMVSDGQQLDIKSKKWNAKFKGEWSIYDHTLVRYDDYGNMLYGAAGTAFGLSKAVLLLGANVNQLTKTGFDDEKDAYAIERGIKLYHKILNENNN